MGLKKLRFDELRNKSDIARRQRYVDAIYKNPYMGVTSSQLNKIKDMHAKQVKRSVIARTVGIEKFQVNQILISWSSKK
ncbi:hypothetical protein IC620_15415 [Hazenella sp. IB182357]|uniref:Uncharacterized protein n=1 Tax=Polycladospora coralii TaxID=2771432 RepID=A0A926NHN4_9BACL|nr:hypothetical protein [Polycladospora coralii]MBD1373734.1 hypothetical protein [Polycladospora coralii]